MILYFGCALVAIWIIQLFFSRRPESNSVPEDGKRTFDKWLRKNASSLMLIIFILVGLMFIYGDYFYPDAPITKCGDSYCGKQRTPHTLEEFRAFENWQGLLVLTFGAGFLALLYLKTKIPPNRKSDGMED